MDECLVATGNLLKPKNKTQTNTNAVANNKNHLSLSFESLSPTTGTWGLDSLSLRPLGYHLQARQHAPKMNKRKQRQIKSPNPNAGRSRSRTWFEWYTRVPRAWYCSDRQKSRSPATSSPSSSSSSPTASSSTTGRMATRTTSLLSARALRKLSSSSVATDQRERSRQRTACAAPASQVRPLGRTHRRIQAPARHRSHQGSITCRQPRHYLPRRPSLKELVCTQTSHNS
jgi:hypothetical protein